jgi:ssDNA-binding Zn-finger/Zn-ribbon topoisomerase 1
MNKCPKCGSELNRRGITGNKIFGCGTIVSFDNIPLEFSRRCADFRITELEAKVKRLEEALKPFARWAAYYNRPTPKHDSARIHFSVSDLGTIRITVGDLRKAAAALEDKKP